MLLCSLGGGLEWASGKPGPDLVGSALWVSSHPRPPPVSGLMGRAVPGFGRHTPDWLWSLHLLEPLIIGKMGTRDRRLLLS